MVKKGKDALPDFAGPFVQGPSGERFVYLDIGTCAGQTNTPWSRRLKIPLSGITWDLIEAGGVLLAAVPGTGTDGGPSCAYAWRKRNPNWQWQLHVNSSMRVLSDEYGTRAPLARLCTAPTFRNLTECYVEEYLRASRLRCGRRCLRSQ